MSETITRAVRVEIVKPLNHGGWEAVGPKLRALRTITHRVQQAVFLACCSAEREQRKAGSAKLAKEMGLPSPRTESYRAAAEEIEAIRAWAKTKLKDKQEGSTMAALAELEISSSLQLGLAGAGFAGFAKWSKDKQRNAMPEWRRGAPLAIAAAGVSVSADSKGNVLSVALDPGRSERYDFAIKCGKGSNYGIIRKMSTGEAEPGETKLVYDERQKKWFAFVSFTEPKPTAPPACDPEHIMVVHRGVNNALTILSSRGRVRWVRGTKLIATKKKLVARRHSMQCISRCERGDGTHGHGRSRRYQSPDALSEKESRVVRTWCQQMGAAVAKLASEWGCGSVFIEDYGGIPQTGDIVQRYLTKFPFYQLKQSIAWSLTKTGLPLGEVPTEYLASVCPACGTVNDKKPRGVFHCAACGFDRDADWVAGFNMLKKVGGAGELMTKLAKERELIPKKGQAA